MLAHYEEVHHSLAISFSDLSFWCYLCDSYVESPQLSALLRHFQTVKFGEDIEQVVNSLQSLKVEEAKIEEAKEEEEKEEEEPVSKPTAAPMPRPQETGEQPVSAKSLEEICEQINAGTFKRITFMAGAGISVSAGIPDFRTPGTGLYSRLQEFNLPQPEAIFTLDFFKQNPQPFYTLAKEMFAGQFKPTPTHYFIRLLHEKGLLHMCFTQNIDGLELKAGLPQEKLVQAHGHCSSSHCTGCRREFPQAEMQEHMANADPAFCGNCGKVAKPDIVFFGESLPERFFYEAQRLDQTDLLIVAGTSLMVFPFAALVSNVPKSTPKVLINRELVGNIGKSTLTYLQGDCDDIVWQLARALGWDEELRSLLNSS
jgi:NAD-dependent histone deacetylase SIR2